MHAWHNLITTSIFFEDDGNENFEGFTISNEGLLKHQLKEYAEATLKNKVLNEIDLNECFNIDKDIPVTGILTDSEILDKVLHANQNEEADDDDEEIEGDTKERISNSKCIQLTQKLIRGMEQKSFVSEFDIKTMINIQELFLKQKTNVKQIKIDKMLHE